MTVKWVVTLLGVGLIFWVNWYFLSSRKKREKNDKK